MIPRSPACSRYELRIPTHVAASRAVSDETRRLGMALDDWVVKAEEHNAQATLSKEKWDAECAGRASLYGPSGQNAYGTDAARGALNRLQQWQRWRPFNGPPD